MTLTDTFFRVGLAASLVVTGACSPTRSNPEPVANAPAPANAMAVAPAQAKGTVPTSVTNTGEFAENIYDAAQTRNWNLAAEKLKALDETVAQARTQASVQVKAEPELEPALAALTKAIASKNKQEAMHRSNQITSIAANLAEPFHPAVPADINRLDFYGRELEVWSAASNKGKLQSTVRDMRQAWSRVRPSVESHGGQTVAAKFDALVSRAELAKTTGAFKSVAKPILDEVDNLEKVFEK